MKLIEVSVVYETILENKVEAIEGLLKSRLDEFKKKPFDVVDFYVRQHYNNKGNYTLIGRVLLEYPGELLNDEVSEGTSKFNDFLENSMSELVSSGNTISSLRKITDKLI